MFDGLTLHLVTPTKAGVHHHLFTFQQQVMDFRRRGSDKAFNLRRRKLHS